MKTSKKLKPLYDLTDKQDNLDDFINSYLNKTLTMFNYTGLPETLPRVVLEKMLQLNGYAVVFKYGGSLYATVGGLCGQENSPYNLPTQVIINVPALGINQTLTINQNCVLIKNDDMQVGLLPTLRKHGTQLVENEITMLLNDYNDRIQTLISGGSDQTINSANKYLTNIIDGNLTTVAESSFINDLQVHNTQSQAKIDFQDLISYHQFIQSDLYNEIGLDSLNNMKKERLISAEVETGDETTYPLVDNMMLNREEGLDMVNKLFNGNIQVDYNSAWKQKQDTQTDDNQEVESNTVDEPETKAVEAPAAAPETPKATAATEPEPKAEPDPKAKPKAKEDSEK